MQTEIPVEAAAPQINMEDALACLEQYRQAIMASPSMAPEQLQALRISCDRLSDACAVRLGLGVAVPSELSQIPGRQGQACGATFVDFGNIQVEMVVHKRIDKGGCGVVYLGSLRGELVAVKTPSLNHYTEQGRREVATEIAFFQSCPAHLNLVCGYGHGTWGEELALVLEQCDCDIEPHQLSMPCFEAQVQAGLEHLRESGWRNPDIKRGKRNNIMLKGSAVKLIDFGQARQI